MIRLMNYGIEEMSEASAVALRASTSAETASADRMADGSAFPWGASVFARLRGLPSRLHAVLGHWLSGTCVGVQGSPRQSHHAFSRPSLDGFDCCTIYRDDRFVL